MNRRWRNQSIIIFLLLVFSCVLIFSYSSATANDNISVNEVIDFYGIQIGDSVAVETGITNTNDSMRLPLLSKPSFIIHEILALNFKDIIISLTTGAVSFDLTSISSGGIDGYGFSTVSTPGYIQVENGKLVIKELNGTVYGRSYNYKYLVKTESGFDLYENGSKIKSIKAENVRSENFGANKSNTEIADFYNSADNKIGSIYPLEFGVKNINDGRNNLTPDEIKKCFNKDISSYASKYPQGDPIILYMPNYTEVECAEYTTYLGDHSEYGNSLREFNAKQFCYAWNNTIIPDNSSSSGKSVYNFKVAPDNSSPGGGATHGVCPACRVLRDAVLAEGFPLPTGVLKDENCVSYGFHPTVDIIVTNNGTVPIKIIMWTTGSGVGMVIHCKLIKLVPNDKLDQYDLTNSTKKVVNTETGA